MIVVLKKIDLIKTMKRNKIKLNYLKIDFVLTSTFLHDNNIFAISKFPVSTAKYKAVLCKKIFNSINLKTILKLNYFNIF